MAGAGIVLVFLMVLVIVVRLLPRSAAATPSASQPGLSVPSLSMPTASAPTAAPTATQLTWDELQVGDCLAGTKMGLGNTSPWPDVVAQVSCGQPHEAEVYFVGGLWANPPAAYPGQKTVTDQANTRCTAAFATYDGTDLSESLFSITNIVDEDASDWSSDGNNVVCVAYYPSSTGPSGGMPVSYSIKGSNK